MKKLVIKPKNINIDFFEWWDTLSDDQTVSLREDKYYKNYYFKNLKDSETLVNELEYEIELEFIGNKKSKQLNDLSMEEKKKAVMKSLNHNIMIILQSLQQNEFIIGNNEKKSVREEFASLTSLYKFSDSIPLGITLERDDIMELANDEYEEVNNIRKNYCVTEKADGERNLLFINDIGEIYLGNRQNEIRKLGIKSVDYANTLLDGEY